MILTNRNPMTNTALLIVDVQNGIAAKKPYAFDEIITNIKKLLEKFRELTLPVIFVQHDDEVGSELEPGTNGWEIVKEIAPNKKDKVIRKRFNSAFRETTLEKELHEQGITTLIIAGMQTELCIDTTIRVAFEKGFEIIIPEKTNTTINGKYFSGKEVYEHHNHLFRDRFGRIEAVEEVLKAL